MAESAHPTSDSDAEEEGLSDIDLERRRLMARNRAKLLALGISVSLMELQDLTKKHRDSKARRPRQQQPRQQQPAEPTRRSTRQAGGGAAGGTGGGEGEQLVELGEDGMAVAQGAERPPRPAGRSGAALEGLTEEEIAARAEDLRARQAARLRELELDGLVDLTPDTAVFVVIGSTGNHYTVRLSDEKRSCQCMDCRIRKRDCKHIRLILSRLQIEDRPSDWHEAVERCFHAAASAGGGPASSAEAGPAQATAAQHDAAASSLGAGAGGKGRARGRAKGSKRKAAAKPAAGGKRARGARGAEGDAAAEPAHGEGGQATGEPEAAAGTRAEPAPAAPTAGEELPRVGEEATAGGEGSEGEAVKGEQREEGTRDGRAGDPDNGEGGKGAGARRSTRVGTRSRARQGGK